MEPEVAPSLAESSLSPNFRPSAAANLRIALDERASWIAKANSESSPPRAALAPGEVRLPLRLVVHRCLDEWGVDSDSSEDDDDFCGWRVGSRLLSADLSRKSRQAAGRGACVAAGGFGVAVWTPAGSSKASAGTSAAGGGATAAAPERSSSSGAMLAEELRSSFSALGASLSSGRPPGAPPASERPSSGTKCLLM